MTVTIYYAIVFSRFNHSKDGETTDAQYVVQDMNVLEHSYF